MDIGNFLGGIAGFLGNNAINLMVGALSGLVLWKVIDFLWDKFKPLQPFTDYAKKRSNEFGLKTREFIEKRISNPAFREKVLKELEDDSEAIQDAYVSGLNGMNL